MTFGFLSLMEMVKTEKVDMNEIAKYPGKRLKLKSMQISDMYRKSDEQNNV